MKREEWATLAVAVWSADKYHNSSLNAFLCTLQMNKVSSHLIYQDIQIG